MLLHNRRKKYFPASVRNFTVVLWVLLLCSQAVFGQWTNSLEKAKKLVVDTQTPYNISSIENPDGGFYIVWQDKKDNNIADIYFQSIELNGKVRLRGDGKNISTRPGVKENPVAKVNVNGQLFVLWKENMNTECDELCIQKTIANGALQWGDEGVRVYKENGRITNYSLAVDSIGNAYVSYIEKANTTPAQYFVKVQKISADGEIETPDSLMLVSTTKEQKYSTLIIPDQKQGAFVLWLEARQGKNVLFVQHLDKAGNKSYFAKPVEVSSANDDILSYTAASLKNGQVTAIWQTGGKNKEILFRSIDEKGKYLFAEPKKAAPRIKGSKSNIQLTQSPDNSIIVSWLNESGKTKNVFCQKITHDGKLAWGDDAQFVSYKPSNKFGQALTTDRLGESFITWFERGESASDTYVYAQKINKEGHLMWDSVGVPMLLSKGTEKSYPAVINDRKQGIIVILKEADKNGSGIYGQRLFAEKKQFTPLLELATAVNGDSISVSWKTGSGSMIKAFRIEKFLLKTINDTNWTEVITVPAKVFHDANDYSYSFMPDTDGVYFIRVLQLAENTVLNASEIQKVSYLRPIGDKIVVLQNIPNPFADSTVINYYLPEPMLVRFEFYNSRIEKMDEKEILDTQKGRNTFVFHAGNLPSGTYFYRFTAKDVIEVKKFVIDKSH